MMIADSQVHLWSHRPENANPWHRKIPQYTAPELLSEMDEAGVDRAIIVPPMWMGDDNTQAIEAAAAHPDRLAILGRFPLFDPSAAAQLPDWNDQPGMLGIRFTFGKPEEQDLLRSGDLEWFWAAAEEHGIPVMFMLSGHIDVVPAIAEAHPDLKLTIDHLGFPGQKVDDEAFAPIPELVAMAKYENLSVKATTLPAYSSQDYPYPNTHDVLHRVFDAYGPHRLFWGSDVTRLPCSYRQSVTQFTEEMPWLAGEDLELVMGRALCDWIGWEY